MRLVGANCHRMLSLGVSSTDGKMIDIAIADVAADFHQLQALDVSFAQGRITNESTKAHRATATRCGPATSPARAVGSRMCP